MTRGRTYLTEITGDAGLRHAQEIAASLRRAFAEHADIAVSVSGITHADITTIQLLLAARRSALAAGKTFVLAAAPEGALRDLLVDGGFLSGADDEFWTPSPQPAKGKAA